MKENALAKLVFVLGIGVMGLTFFKFKNTKVNDVRFIAEAAYTCSGTCYSASCSSLYQDSGSGTCNPLTPNCCVPKPVPCNGFCTGVSCSTIGVDWGTGVCSGSGYCCYIAPSPTPIYGCQCINTVMQGVGCATDVVGKPCVVSPTIACSNCSGSQYCSYKCNNCPAGTDYATYVNTKITKCYASQLCSGGITTCSVSDPIQDEYHCGDCPATVPTPTGNCQPLTCTNTCGLGGCPGGCGSVDNCGGPDCSSCPGTVATSTPVPGPTSTNPTVTPTSTACSCLVPTQEMYCSDSGYKCSATSNTYCKGLKGCSPPTFTSLVMKNADSVVVTPNSSGRNQICENTFTGSSLPRRIIFDVNVDDADGYANINTITLYWNTSTFTLTSANLISHTVTGALYRKTVDFPAALNDSLSNSISVKVVDDDGNDSGQLHVGRSLKVWDCQVPISGSMYDSSAEGGAVCATETGFTDLAPASMNFKSVTLKTGGTSTVVAASGESYSGTVLWGKTYTVNANTDLAASGTVNRWLDTSVAGTTVYAGCGVGNTVEVDAYHSKPALEVDLSAVANQDPWFQVSGGGIAAKASIEAMTPVTCVAPCVPAMTIDSANASNGLVAAPMIENNAGCTLGGPCYYGVSKNWGYSKNVVNDSTGYNYFYNNYYAKTGQGVFIGTGTSMSNILASGIGGTGVVLVKGNLVIDQNNTVASGKFLMIVVSGKITILSGVTQTEGIFVADGGISAIGTNATQLKINGSIYAAGGDISFTRGYTAATTNNISPGVLATFRPDLMFNLPGSLAKVLTSWSQGK